MEHCITNHQSLAHQLRSVGPRHRNGQQQSLDRQIREAAQEQERQDSMGREPCDTLCDWQDARSHHAPFHTARTASPDRNGHPNSYPDSQGVWPFEGCRQYAARTDQEIARAGYVEQKDSRGTEPLTHHCREKAEGDGYWGWGVVEVKGLAFEGQSFTLYIICCWFLMFTTVFMGVYGCLLVFKVFTTVHYINEWTLIFIFPSFFGSFIIIIQI